MILKQILNLVGDNTPTSESIDAQCCVCNANLIDGGEKFSAVMSKSSFNLNHEFKNMRSDYMCNYCAVFFSRKKWEQYCKRNGHDPHFPEVPGKKRSMANWVFFSHYFAKNDHRIVKKRQDWRAYLLNPPQPPFCFVLSTLCKKHLIFKSEMAYSRDGYPITFESQRVYINRDELKTALTAFETLYNAGLSKSSIRTGDYNSKAMMSVDRTLFIENEEIIQRFRLNNPVYLEICEFIGGKND